MTIKVLPEKDMKIWGLPNRFLIPVLLGLTGVFVEVLLNKCGMLTWDYRWWCWPNVYLIIPGYCAPLLVLVWLHDNLSLRAKKIGALLMPGLAALCHILFASILGWV